MNYNPYNLPRFNSKNTKKSSRQMSNINPEDTKINKGRPWDNKFRITVEEKEIKILERIIENCITPEEEFIKTICERIIEEYNNRSKDSKKPLRLNQKTSDLLHSIFLPSW